MAVGAAAVVVLPLLVSCCAGGAAGLTPTPPRPSGLLDAMLRTFPSSSWQYTSTMNAALCVLPDSRTAAYFSYATFPASKISKQIYVTTSSDGEGWTAAVPQPGPAPWYPAVLAASESVYEVPQCLVLPPPADGSPSVASLMWQAYPLGLRAGIARWNASAAAFNWPRTVTALAAVDNANDGGINRPPIRLRTGRLFHIGAGANMPGAGCGGIGMMGAFSDDGGLHWQHSATNLSVPHTAPNPKPSCGAADEPMTVELSNGTLWTLVRTNGGGSERMATSTLWEAFSDDGGEHWRGPPQPSSLISWGSPAAVMRLDRAAKWLQRAELGGSGVPGVPPILVLWTNARTGQDYSESTRSLLHAALSFDDGRTFRGHREVARDPQMKTAPYPDSDTGVGYPSAVEQAGGSVLIQTGQGKGRWQTILLDPAWLLETSQSVNFSAPSAATAWNHNDDMTGTYVSTCTVAHQWANMLVGGRLIYCPDCSPEIAKFAYWQPQHSSLAHPVAANKSLGCATGYCGIAYFSPCGTALPLAAAEWSSTVTIGSPFNCSMLPPQPLQPPAKTCAPSDGVALRKPQLTSESPRTTNATTSAASTTPASTALCASLGMAYPISPSVPGMAQATAYWNFPSTAKGSLVMTLALESHSNDHSGGDYGGAVLALSDHAAPAWDDRTLPSVSLFAVLIDAHGQLSGSSGGGGSTSNGGSTSPSPVALPFGRWLTLRFNWTLSDGGTTGGMDWAVDEIGARGSLPLLTGVNEGAISYWSLQSRGVGATCVGAIDAKSGNAAANAARLRPTESNDRKALPLKVDDHDAKRPVKLIVDTDMSSDIDDVAAVCVAHALADMGEVELAAVVHNTGLVQGAGALSVINHYFDRDDVPIGAFIGDFDNPVVKQKPKGYGAGSYVLPLVAKFPSPVRNSSQVPSGVEVYRRVLSAAADHSVTISSIGFMSNLAALIESKPDKYSNLSGVDLVAKKVQLIVWMGGQYPNSTVWKTSGLKTGAEWNFGGGYSALTGPWSATAVSKWPTNVPIVFSGFEMGAQVFTGASMTGRCCNQKLPAPWTSFVCPHGLVACDMSAPPRNACQPVNSPCRAAFESYFAAGGRVPRQSWDPATTLYAVRGAGTCWNRHSTGYNVVNETTGANHWVDDGKDHNRSYLVLKPGAQQLVAQAIDNLLCAKPKSSSESRQPLKFNDDAASLSQQSTDE